VITGHAGAFAFPISPIFASRCIHFRCVVLLMKRSVAEKGARVGAE
jgi:hypothetical protein